MDGLCRLSFVEPRHNLSMLKVIAKAEFQWTDDEAELLINIMHKYKVNKSAVGIYWESISSKYEVTLVHFQEALLFIPSEACGKDYPHEPMHDVLKY